MESIGPISASPLLLVGHGRVTAAPRVLGWEGPALVVGIRYGDGAPHRGLHALLLGILHGARDVAVRWRLHAVDNNKCI
jgi:hypothetical protein